MSKFQVKGNNGTTVRIQTQAKKVFRVDGSLRGPKGPPGPSGTDGEDGRNIELQNNGTHVQWRYVGNDFWTDLVDISVLAGADGANGTNGTDGREVEFQISATHIQWRYVGESWIDLIAIADLKGADGINGTNGTDGADGREVEFQKNTTHIQWRYVGDASWIDLVALADISGDDGDPGTNGSNGDDGRTILSGTGIPSSGLGVNGDFYIDTAAYGIYGPKTAGSWGSSTSLVGPAGPGTGDMVASVYDPAGGARQVAFADELGGGGVTDHGALTGLSDDDHTQYHTDARGDARYTPIAHASNTSNPHSVTKAQVGLGNVDNTADTAKPVSTAQQAALDTKAAVSHTHGGADITGTGKSSTTFLRGDGTWVVPTNTTYTAISQAEAENAASTTARLATGQRLAQAALAHSPVKSVAGKTGVVTLDKADVGLSNVTNDAQLKAADLDTDDELTADSDAKIPSQKAIRSYIENNYLPRQIVTVDDLPTSGIVSAHRGGGPTDLVPVAPEATIQGYLTAMSLGAHIMDIDYRTTLDGVLIGMHNTTVNRTTDGYGDVSKHLSSALPKVAPGRYVGFGWPDEPVVTIDELLQTLGGKTIFTIEAKEGVPAVAPLAGLIKKYHLEKSVFINTNNLDVVDEILANGCLAHLWAWDNMTKAKAGIDRGAHLIEIAYNSSSGDVAVFTTAVSNPAKNLRWFVAGPINTRAQATSITSGIMGHVTDALGMTNRSTGNAPLVTSIGPSLMAGKRGIGWRYFSEGGSETKYPIIVPGAGLRFNDYGIIPTPSTNLRRGIYLGDMSGTMPSSYTMTLKFRPLPDFIDRNRSVRMRVACTIPDSGGQDADTDGYIPILNGNGRLRLYTSNGSFGAGTLLYENATAATLVPGQEYSLVMTVTSTNVTVSCPEISKASGNIANTNWRGQHHYIWQDGMDAAFITDMIRS